MTLASEPVAKVRSKLAQSSAAADSVLLLLIVVMPVTATPLMQARIVDLPGFKIPNLIAALALLAFLGGGRILRATDKFQKRALITFGIYLLLLTVAFLRSVPHVPRFHARVPESIPASVAEYWQSYFLAPVLFALSFVYVLQRMCSRIALEQIIVAVSLAMFAVSCTVLVAMLGNPAVVLDMDPLRNATNALIASYLGLHYNAVGTLYVTTAPLLLYMALQRGSLWMLNLLLAIVAVLLVKSRTGIFVFAGMGVVTLITLGRAKALLGLAPIVAAGALAALGKVLVSLITIGFTKSGISTYSLLSGREQAIWLPLIAEWVSDPQRLWSGAGLFGVLMSDFLISSRSNFAAGQAHNFYLEFFLDNGIVAFAIFMGVLIYGLIAGYRMGKRLHCNLYWVLYLCIVSFLIAGFSGRRYFPEAENFLMFPLIAALVNVLRLRLPHVRTALTPHLPAADARTLG